MGARQSQPQATANNNFAAENAARQAAAREAAARAAREAEAREAAARAAREAEAREAAARAARELSEARAAAARCNPGVTSPAGQALTNIINHTDLYQDVELATAIGQIKRDPAQLQQFLQSQQDKVYKDVTKQKDSTFEKVYGDLTRSMKAQESSIMHNKRNMELSKLNTKIYETQKSTADAITQDKDLANRKYEMNEWSVNNKKDTLFVFSMLFIMLSALILLTGLWRMGFISASLLVLISIPLIAIFVFTVVYRSQYTDVFRNKRYWNRRIFEGKYGKIPVPLCPGAINDIEGGFESIKTNIGGGISSIEKGAANLTKSFAQGVANTAQGIADSAAPAGIPAAAPITN
jgi:hypothetical protein